MFAFRCRTCGLIETSANAGERTHPAACPVCGAGVSFDPRTGIKEYDTANWQPLADASDDELAAWGLTRDQVIAHVPATPAEPDHQPQAIDRSATETLGAEDVTS